MKEKLGKMIIWCDNCGSHKTTSVKDVIREIGVDVVFLGRSLRASDFTEIGIGFQLNF